MKTENFSKTKIKICGLRRREDILAVNEAKPDYCGFIVEYPKSRRSIDRATLRELVRGLREEIVPVGVFVNAPKELVAELLEEGTIQIAQLHGQESQEYIQELKVLTEKPLIQAFSIKSKEDVERARESVFGNRRTECRVAFDHIIRIRYGDGCGSCTG